MGIIIMTVWIYTILSVIAVSLISLVGIFTLSFGESKIRKVILFFVSFAVGALFGDALIHLIPETFEKMESNLLASMLVLSGIIIFFALEKFIHWRHCHDASCEGHLHPVITMNIVGDMVHNLIDGMIIAGSFSISVPLGIATTIAVVLHEIPQEIGDFGIMIHGGLTVKKALMLNFLSATTAILGAVIVLAVGSRITGSSVFLLPVTAGGFLYIAGSDLIPELKHETKITVSIGQLLAMILGIAVMAALLLVD
ncbi:MAG: ZIP family metal transporter [Parcubacteria group bacterium]|jgi:zinc and cadmium transporter